MQAHELGGDVLMLVYRCSCAGSINQRNLFQDTATQVILQMINLLSPAQSFDIVALQAIQKSTIHITALSVAIKAAYGSVGGNLAFPIAKIVDGCSRLG